MAEPAAAAQTGAPEPVELDVLDDVETAEVCVATSARFSRPHPRCAARGDHRQGAEDGSCASCPRRQRANDAYQRQYENDHTWDTLQEDEHGMLQVVRARRAQRGGGAGSAAAAAALQAHTLTLWIAACHAFPQDRTREQRQRRERALAAAAAQQGRVRKGMIRYMLLVRWR